MRRTLIKDTVDLIGQTVKIAGWASIRRDHGKLIFIDVRDRSGTVQVVVIPDKEEAYGAAKEVRSEFVLEVEGLVKERPGGSANAKITTGRVEIEAENVNILSRTEGELPIDISNPQFDVNLETILEHRHLSLRQEKIKAIFKVFDQLLWSYSEFMRTDEFVEIKTPKILSAATEGGANFFKINYFDREAYLAQSPQFYKQAGVGFFERVFEIGPVFRAEPHFTSRHINEYIGLDAEMGFIDSFEDVMDKLEKTMQYVFESVARKCPKELEMHGAEVAPWVKFPRLKLTEALEIMEKEYSKKMEGIDIDAEGERLICRWVKDNFQSDFVFLTHYPTNLRPFYSMPSADPQYTETFDLLYRGVEIASGGQRIHDYKQLVANIEKHHLNPDEFKDYLDIFKNGMPPHGGWGLGAERIVQKILGLANIKEASLYPRDVRRLSP